MKCYICEIQVGEEAGWTVCDYCRQTVDLGIIKRIEAGEIIITSDSTLLVREDLKKRREASIKEAEGKAERCSFPQEEDEKKLSTNLLEAQTQIDAAYQDMVNEKELGEIADKIGDQFDNAIWSLKADIFTTLKEKKVVAEDAEGPDNEELIKVVLDELWRRA